ncbi:hypothetical protein PG994_004682 [Apiospora phragmitis]|uniref:Uncharacterized protein n=1 Tax=Apiospora phragmitis TaxID=2905665 RepID=A0ABR1VRA0_9PEZI
MPPAIIIQMKTLKPKDSSKDADKETPPGSPQPSPTLADVPSAPESSKSAVADLELPPPTKCATVSAYRIIKVIVEAVIKFIV